ncbi:acyl-CoA dehydrogenase [Microbacterium excoecariae]|uniref:acyl-CoA dehydrogenase n=1 Tax=Microbacterium excoecariae TaxID=2715210 RepID=UPI00140B4ECE|nr:acyl-CoA dehydrogenase [Microbacterium excoecariae]NHI17813.1 acyl-CoA dehydrogenase [Microbacterium excoecariae]
MPQSPSRSRRSAKVVAIVSASALAAVGGLFSLAAWTDTEWITSALQDDSGTNIETSSFEVVQRAYPAAGEAGAYADFDHYESADGADVVTFSDLSLTPTEPTYGLVGMTTEAGSIAGALELQPAVNAFDPASTAQAALFAATDITVWTWSEADATPEFGCDAATAAQAGVTEIAAGDLGTSGATATQSLSADTGAYQYYCFELVFTMPAGEDEEDYMGVELRPAWEFDGLSS